MDACVFKPKTPFVTAKPLKPTPISEENRQRRKFINTHNFSFQVDESGELICKVTEK